MTGTLPLRLERKLDPSYPSQPAVTFVVDLPAGFGPRDVAVARRTLDAAAAAFEGACDQCGTPLHHVHFPDCILAAPDFLELLVEEAIRDGYRP